MCPAGRSPVPVSPMRWAAGFPLPRADRLAAEAVHLQCALDALRVGGMDAHAGFGVDRVYDLSGVVPEQDNITPVLPDFSGLLWFVTTDGLVGTIDPVTYALVDDALNHRGPADPARVDTAVCGQPLMPYVDPASVNTYLQPLSALPGLASTALPGVNLVGARSVDREPQLSCYVYAAGC